MYLKVKIPGSNGKWRLFEVDEIEWNTTRREIQNWPVSFDNDPKCKCYLSSNLSNFYVEIWVRKCGDNEDIKIYCNTQAYILNDNGETIETIIRQFRTVNEKLN